MPSLTWYWSRLRATSPGELALHARKKWRQFVDAHPARDWAAVKLESSGVFPHLPRPEQAPESLRVALQHDQENILAGRWSVFGHLAIKVDDPPKWHCDYLAGRDLVTTASAFKLDHRALPRGADIKLIWELSRWSQLARLAQAAYVLNDARAAEKCIVWLEDWVKHNPPYRGWNWTSALEAGLRLVQFTWIDALLADKAEAWGFEAELETLRYEILPPHVWFAWRHMSFGSSANNHLIGELTGLTLATVRWPALTQWGATLEALQERWQREVLAQFAPDGGNREQALNYHWFSWELCWQARMALGAAGKTRSSIVEKHLDGAARFFWEVQARREPWDYGDSDGAYATPFFARETTALCEWRDWLSRRNASGALEYWLGEFPESPPSLGFREPINAAEIGQWWFFQDTGIAVSESGFWWLRWDLSPLGYLRTAAHGHLDALHLSIWYRGVALVIDPGTGAYYTDDNLRAWLASRAAHNGPCPVGAEWPARRGPFLWSAHHATPLLHDMDDHAMGVLDLPECQLRRRIRLSPNGLAWVVEDDCATKNGTLAAFSVRWQFPPGTQVRLLSDRKFVLTRSEVFLTVEVGPEWAGVRMVETEADRAGDAPLAGTVSPAFRQTRFAPYLHLTASAGEKPCLFRTTFLASGLTQVS